MTFRDGTELPIYFFVAVKAEMCLFKNIPEKLNPIDKVLFVDDHTNDILVTTRQIRTVSLLSLFCMMKMLNFFLSLPASLVSPAEK